MKRVLVAAGIILSIVGVATGEAVTKAWPAQGPAVAAVAVVGGVALAVMTVCGLPRERERSL